MLKDNRLKRIEIDVPARCCRISYQCGERLEMQGLDTLSDFLEYLHAILEEDDATITADTVIMIR